MCKLMLCCEMGANITLCVHFSYSSEVKSQRAFHIHSCLASCSACPVFKMAWQERNYNRWGEFRWEDSANKDQHWQSSQREEEQDAEAQADWQVSSGAKNPKNHNRYRGSLTRAGTRGAANASTTTILQFNDINKFKIQSLCKTSATTTTSTRSRKCGTPDCTDGRIGRRRNQGKSHPEISRRPS